MPYCFQSLSFQYAIGSLKTVFIDLGLNVELMLGKHFNMTVGATFTHFSNGVTKVPNYGINLLVPRIGVKYIFRGRPEFITFENLFLGINIRAYDFGIADYVEWNIGYRVKWR